MSQLISVSDIRLKTLSSPYHEAFYSIFLLPEATRYIVDGTDYSTTTAVALFLSPYQRLEFCAEKLYEGVVRLLKFHGDYYCIEQHKEEVACNGLLFNNAYLSPHVAMQDSVFRKVEQLTDDILDTAGTNNRFTEAVKKSYLQLILALCSKAKSEQIAVEAQTEDALLASFQHLLTQHHQRERSVAFYADLLGCTPEALSRRVKAIIGKTATQLVQDQVILTAKRQLHLTRRSIKEIATEMNFDDEYYFSRYFKRHTGLSPKHFRAEVGISVVAQ